MSSPQNFYIGIVYLLIFRVLLLLIGKLRQEILYMIILRVRDIISNLKNYSIFVMTDIIFICLSIQINLIKFKQIKKRIFLKFGHLGT